jgi:hypothetical protein
MDRHDTIKVFSREEIQSKEKGLSFYKESLKKNQFLEEISFYGKNLKIKKNRPRIQKL